jgi:hypothetical protein
MEIARVEELLEGGPDSEVEEEDEEDAKKDGAQVVKTSTDSQPSDGVTAEGHSLSGAFEELLLRQQQQQLGQGDLDKQAEGQGTQDVTE